MRAQRTDQNLDIIIRHHASRQIQSESWAPSTLSRQLKKIETPDYKRPAVMKSEVN